MAARTLTRYLLDVGSRDPSATYVHLLSAVSVSVKLTAAAVSRGRLILDEAGAAPPSDRSVNRGLRQLASRHLLSQTEEVEELAGISFSGRTTFHRASSEGRYLLVFEAMHGMHNLSENLPVGSVFSVLQRDPTTGACTAIDFLQPGTRQVCAGFALYGPRTMLVLTTGQGVDGFTLDRDVGNFVLTHPSMTIPPDATNFAVDATDAPYWPAPVKRYVEECVLGSTGPRGHDFRMRWNASALLGAYRVLTSGGLFLVPETDKPDGWLAPLLHTANPLAMLAEQAGGAATTGSGRVLEVVPHGLTATVPLFFGAAYEVALIEEYFSQHEHGYDREFTHPLFHTRTLFAD